MDVISANPASFRFKLDDGTQHRGATKPMYVFDNDNTTIRIPITDQTDKFVREINHNKNMWARELLPLEDDRLVSLMSNNTVQIYDANMRVSSSFPVENLQPDAGLAKSGEAEQLVAALMQPSVVLADSKERVGDVVSRLETCGGDIRRLRGWASGLGNMGTAVIVDGAKSTEILDPRAHRPQVYMFNRRQMTIPVEGSFDRVVTVVPGSSRTNNTQELRMFDLKYKVENDTPGFYSTQQRAINNTVRKNLPGPVRSVVAVPNRVLYHYGVVGEHENVLHLLIDLSASSVNRICRLATEGMKIVTMRITRIQKEEVALVVCDKALYVFAIEEIDAMPSGTLGNMPLVSPIATHVFEQVFDHVGPEDVLDAASFTKDSMFLTFRGRSCLKVELDDNLLGSLVDDVNEPAIP